MTATEMATVTEGAIRSLEQSTRASAKYFPGEAGKTLTDRADGMAEAAKLIAAFKAIEEKMPK